MPVRDYPMPEDKPPSIHPSQLTDGQIGKIVSPVDAAFVGQTVQRYGQDLMSLGKPSTHAWLGACQNSSSSSLRVQICSDGECFEIFDNQ